MDNLLNPITMPLWEFAAWLAGAIIVTVAGSLLAYKKFRDSEMEETCMGYDIQIDRFSDRLNDKAEQLETYRRLLTNSNCEIARWRALFGDDLTHYEKSKTAIAGHDHNKKTIAVDLDGVIARYDGKWRGNETFGMPQESVIGGLRVLREMGFKLIVYTTRTNPLVPGHNKDAQSLSRLVKEYLDLFCIPYDAIALGKPLAAYYIDDRAIRFHDWPQVVRDVLFLESGGVLGITPTGKGEEKKEAPASTMKRLASPKKVH